mmetsp:Transcript_21261/g.39677  ORF Transcript_21261/g.39677 Transcript_21261/m.39677 type:complete len:213 (-) Transcript_21261:329-967(-)
MVTTSWLTSVWPCSSVWRNSGLRPFPSDPITKADDSCVQSISKYGTLCCLLLVLSGAPLVLLPSPLSSSIMVAAYIVRTPLLCRISNPSCQLPAWKRGTWKEADMALLTAFGLKTSQHPSNNTIPATPTAREDLNSVPTFPGSDTPSSTKYKDGEWQSPYSSEVVLGGMSTMATIPCGVTVSEHVFLNTSGVISCTKMSSRRVCNAAFSLDR